MILFITILFQLTLLFLLSSKTKYMLYNLFHRITGSKAIAISLLSLLIYPGVVVHELSHAITAVILFVPVRKIELVPEKTDDGIRSGSVTIAHTDPIRRTLVGIAPMFVGIVALWMVMFYLLPPVPLICHSDPPAGGEESRLLMRSFVFAQDGIWCRKSQLPISQFPNFLISVYLLFSISSSMYSSKKDLEALKVMVPILIAFIGILYLFGFQIEWIVKFLKQFQSISQTIMTVLLIPLIIHLIIFVPGKIICSPFRMR